MVEVSESMKRGGGLAAKRMQRAWMEESVRAFKVS